MTEPGRASLASALGVSSALLALAGCTERVGFSRLPAAPSGDTCPGGGAPPCELPTGATCGTNAECLDVCIDALCSPRSGLDGPCDETADCEALYGCDGTTCQPLRGTPSFIDVAAGRAHSCGLTAAGEVYCWGEDALGQLGDGGALLASATPARIDTSAVTGSRTFTQVTTRADHSCALASDGVAYCWGEDADGQLGNGGLGATLPTAVDTASIAGNRAFVQLTAGGQHTCGLMADGAAYCWGSDSAGQLGDGGTSADSATPSPVAQSTIPFLHLAAGKSFTCGVSADGFVHCWGSDSHGQLGNGAATTPAQSPARVNTASVVGSASFIAVVAGGQHACGLTAERVAYCWGSDVAGALGDGGASANAEVPSPVDTSTLLDRFTTLTAGHDLTCGTTSRGATYCWGSDSDGQLGDGGALADSQVPVAVDTSALAGNRALVRLSAGAFHVCAVAADGVPYCWGRDGATTRTSPLPVDTSSVPPSMAFTDVGGGNDHTCALAATGEVYCWGGNANGQLGDGGAAAASPVPVLVDTSGIPGNRAFVQLVVGSYHACGRTADGVVYCWGDDGSSQLGDGGSDVDSLVPSPVDTSGIAGDRTFVELTSGANHTCGITADGAAHCWGLDDFGQLGDGGSMVDAPSPSLVSTASITGARAFRHLGAGWRVTCATMADGGAYCWGADSNGTLGNGGANADTTAPAAVDVSTMTGSQVFASYALGFAHTCGVAVDGRSYCWGSDGYGQLGTGGTPVNSASPALMDTAVVTGNPAFVTLTGGWLHTCGVTADGAAFCWGYDSTGQLGNGSPTSNMQSPSPLDPSSLPSGHTFRSIDAGNGHVCGLGAGGLLHCWGLDAVGQLGDGGGYQDAPSPSAVDLSSL